MFGVLLLLFVAMPFIELYFLFRAGAAIGALNTFALVLVIGILGAALAKTQGQLVWSQFQQNLAQGKVPEDSLIHGLFIFLGGVLLITPGFVTDGIGLCLVAPGLRHLLVKNFKHSLRQKMSSGQVKVYQFGQFGAGSSRPPFGADSYQESREEREAQVVDIIPDKSEHKGPNE